MGVDLWLDPEEYAQFLALLKRDGAVSGFEALTLSPQRWAGLDFGSTPGLCAEWMGT